MIVHSIFIKLKDRSSENIEQVKNLLLSMQQEINTIRSLKVKADIRHAESSYDLALIATFDTLADFHAYLPHPSHIEISNKIKNGVAAAATICYED